MVRKKLCVVSIFIFSLFWSPDAFTQKPMFAQALSPRIANYDISVTLDARNKTLDGSEILTWKNESNDEITELQFHLYLNGFRNPNSTFMRESSGKHRNAVMNREAGYGWINISELYINNGADVSGQIEFIHPDVNDEEDSTVFRIPLEKPLNPHETATISINFTAQLPEVFSRTGYKGDFFMVGQWFPKIGVYEETGVRHAEKGRWNCHQFHLNSEFYADFGVYDVKITVPQNYVVGATGILLSETVNGDTSKTLNYYCEDVHDFAWTADPDFMIFEDSWKHVKIKYLVHPPRDSQAYRQIQAAKYALEYFEDWFGEYLYPTLTIVDPRYKALGAGGMEYPTLITAGTMWLVPESIRFFDDVIVHEFAHNYWYGMVASNEFEEAWLDEGFTTYSTIKVMNEYYGPSGGSVFRLFGLNFYSDEFEWLRYIENPDIDILVKNSWEYERGGYGMLSYSKSSLTLLTLENYLGQELMKQVMRTYFERFRFKHPDSRNFIETVNEVTGQDLNWYFDQALYTARVLDYALDKIEIKEITSYQKMGNDLDKQESDSSEEKPITEKIFESTVVIVSKGDFHFPVELVVRFDDGTEQLDTWDGVDRFHIFTYKELKKVISAEVDPQRKIRLDINILNNGKTAESTGSLTIWKYTSRWFFWMQNLLQIFAFFS